MLVVADASPLILLARLDLLDLLPTLFDRIVTPPEVLREVAAGAGDRPGARAIRAAQWLETMDAEDQDALQVSLRGELDPGEAAAIALARSLDADLLLIDERQGRRIARRLGLTVKGTVGVLVRARREGHIQQLRPVLDRLEGEGAWISEDLRRSVLDAVGEPDDQTEGGPEASSP